MLYHLYVIDWNTASSISTSTIADVTLAFLPFFPARYSLHYTPFHPSIQRKRSKGAGANLNTAT